MGLDPRKPPVKTVASGVLLAVDPSLHNLGFAFFNLSYPENRFEITSRRSWRFGVVHPKGGSRQEKWENAFDQLRACCDWQPTHLAAEWPSFFASMRGKIAASRGHTLELSGIIGYLAGRFAIPSHAITLWRPEQWKGSVPKRVTQFKFERLFGCEAKDAAPHYTDDIIDAIMIAQFSLQLL